MDAIVSHILDSEKFQVTEMTIQSRCRHVQIGMSSD